jgi:hypothetical protein
LEASNLRSAFSSTRISIQLSCAVFLKRHIAEFSRPGNN